MHNPSYQDDQDSGLPTSRHGNVLPSRPTSDLSSSSSQGTTDYAGFWSSSNAADYSLRNQLHSYSFGTAPRLSISPSTCPSATQDEAEYEEFMSRADITPRPSVVAYGSQPLARTSPWHNPTPVALHNGGNPLLSQSTPDDVARDHGRANDSTPSSASASVTSFNDSLYTGSVVSWDSSSVPQTPTNEFTSSEDEDRRYRSDFSISGPYPSSSTNASATSMEFSSEEEYDSDDVPDFEISSARVASVEMSFQEEEHPYYSAEMSYFQGRRGSLPMAIPGIVATPSVSGQYHYGRDRGDSFISFRRPSRSLDDDLHTLDLMRNPTSRTRSDVSDSSPSSPISVPGSEGDWRNLNARTRQRISGTQAVGSLYSSDISRINQTQSSAGSANDVGEFDPDWAALRQGIVSLDHSELRDIVRPPGSAGNVHLPISSRWFPRLVGHNNDSSRRPSVVTISSLGSDTFGKAVFRWGGEGYQSQRHDWTFKREKPTSGVHQEPATVGNVSVRGFAGFLGPKASEEEKRSQKGREREKERLAKAMASWKGMPISSHEVWKMDIIGRFKVERKTTKTGDIAKGPQQRIIVHRLREADTSVFAGPTSTVHKHSKAVAFSVGRYYRRRSESKERIREVNAGPLITASHPPAPSADSQKRHGSMILLAPRRVQIAFTNTTSTRKLESHGLLDEDQPVKSTKEQNSNTRDKEREHKEKGKGKTREGQAEKPKTGKKQERRLREGETERSPLSSLIGSPAPSAVNLSDTSRFTNGSGRASVITSTTIVASSTPSTPLSSLNVELGIPDAHASASTVAGRSITPISTDLSQSKPRRRRRGIHDPLELDEDEEDETGRHSPPTRTPHSETYGTVDASLIEQLNLERAQHELETSSIFRRFFGGRTNRTNLSSATGHLEANYVPPWILLPSRSKQEQQQRVVENLNSSFMDVGLLPSNHRIRKHTGLTSKKKRDDQTNGILSEVPEESLYMLLPLWPSETDPISAQDHLHLLKRIPPTDQRQYLLIYYRSMDSHKKKKKRASPTAEQERTDRSILLTSFHISARFVAHNELIGTGIRVPEEGLTISGALDYAWETLPSAEVREECKSDWVIGVCHSRESGIEFIPEGLVKMDLCRMSWKPPSAVSDNYIPPEPSVQLTPIGQAVVEMAWLGAIALTSFGQVGLV